MTDAEGAVLVVDDDADMREMVQDLLKDRGHHVSTAASGSEALKRLGEADYRVALSDLRMNGMKEIVI